MELQRIAPKKGYDFEEKAEYRDNIWKTFADSVDNASTAKVGFMPSKEGLEIPVALSYGFKEENLFAIDRNKAMLARAAWRKTYPGVKIYGSEIERAGERLAQDKNILDCMNLDLCGCLSVKTVGAIKDFIASGCMCESSILAITLLGGRERRDIVDFLALAKDSLGIDTTDRINLVSNIISIGNNVNTEVMRKGKYQSSSPMIWGVIKVEKSNPLSDMMEAYKNELSPLKFKILAMQEKIDSGEITRKEALSSINIPSGTFSSYVCILRSEGYIKEVKTVTKTQTILDLCNGKVTVHEMFEKTGISKKSIRKIIQKERKRGGKVEYALVAKSNINAKTLSNEQKEKITSLSKGGATAKAISEMLDLSIYTVYKIVENVYRNLPNSVEFNNLTKTLSVEEKKHLFYTKGIKKIDKIFALCDGNRTLEDIGKILGGVKKSSIGCTISVARSNGDKRLFNFKDKRRRSSGSVDAEWTEEKTKALISLRNERKTYKDISAIIGISVCSTYDKVKRLKRDGIKMSSGYTPTQTLMQKNMQTLK